jgi:hypothetical protein
MMQSRMSARLLVLFSMSVAFGGGATAARADDPCGAFTWDVRHERSLFGQAPRPLAAGETPAASPALATDQLYELKLTTLAKVKFVIPPGGKARDKAAYAGLVLITVDAPGVYRVSLDQPVWVDAIASGTLVTAKDFQGRRGCNAPHKIVEFALPAGTPVTLQFSGEVPTAKVSISRSPAP